MDDALRTFDLGLVAMVWPMPEMSSRQERREMILPPQSPPVQIVKYTPAVLTPRQPRYTLPDGVVTTIPRAIQCGWPTKRNPLRTVR